MIEYVNYTSIFKRAAYKLYILMSIKLCLEKSERKRQLPLHGIASKAKEHSWAPGRAGTARFAAFSKGPASSPSQARTGHRIPWFRGNRPGLPLGWLPPFWEDRNFVINTGCDVIWGLCRTPEGHTGVEAGQRMGQETSRDAVSHSGYGNRPQGWISRNRGCCPE